MILGLACLLMLGSVLPGEKKRQVYRSWQDFFPDSVERIYIIMKDYTIFPYTSHYEDMIYIEIGRLEKALKKKGYKIKDIAIIIHNHLDDSRFSILDHKQYRKLKKYGFDGRFLLYSRRTKEVCDILSS